MLFNGFTGGHVTPAKPASCAPRQNLLARAAHCALRANSPPYVRYETLGVVAHRDELLRYSSVFAAQLQLLCSFPLLVNEHIPSDAHGWDHTRLVQLQDFIDYLKAANGRPFRRLGFVL